MEEEANITSNRNSESKSKDLFKQFSNFFIRNSNKQSELKLLKQIFTILYDRDGQADINDIKKFIDRKASFTDIVTVHLITQIAATTDTEINELELLQKLSSEADTVKAALQSQKLSIAAIIEVLEERTNKLLTKFNTKLLELKKSYL